ncbi:sensor domain-containing protein [Halopelagius fulvigenes]|uniref:Sensor domain-containing protein n=1 Tax=Halopelagius fulvigenes TaxID=1198324 RepID=A0ABD5TVI2_9EURY
MAARTLPRSEGLGGALGRIARAPVRRQTYRNLLYVVSMFPLGVLYLNLLAVGVALGLSLAVVGVGLLVLVALLAAVTELAALERAYARRLLGVEIPEPSAEPVPNRLARYRRLATDLRTWTAAGYMVSAFAFGSVVFGVLASLLATAVSFILAPLYYGRAPVVAFGPIPTETVTFDVLFGWDNLLVGLTTTFRAGSWHVETLPVALLFAALGVGLFAVTLQSVNVLAAAWGRYVRLVLTAPRYRDLS